MRMNRMLLCRFHFVYNIADRHDFQKGLVLYKTDDTVCLLKDLRKLASTAQKKE